MEEDIFIDYGYGQKYGSHERVYPLINVKINPKTKEEYVAGMDIGEMSVGIKPDKFSVYLNDGWRSKELVESLDIEFDEKDLLNHLKKAFKNPKSNEALEQSIIESIDTEYSLNLVEPDYYLVEENIMEDIERIAEEVGFNDKEIKDILEKTFQYCSLSDLERQEIIEDKINEYSHTPMPEIAKWCGDEETFNDFIECVYNNIIDDYNEISFHAHNDIAYYEAIKGICKNIDNDELIEKYGEGKIYKFKTLLCSEVD